MKEYLEIRVFQINKELDSLNRMLSVVPEDHHKDDILTQIKELSIALKEINNALEYLNSKL